MSLLQSRLCDTRVGDDATDQKQCGQPVPDNEPTVFAFDGKEFSVDLCVEHGQELRKALQSYLDIAVVTNDRRGRGRQAVHSALKGRSGPVTAMQVREWARAQGREVAPSGRLPRELFEEYAVSQQTGS